MNMGVRGSGLRPLKFERTGGILKVFGQKQMKAVTSITGVICPDSSAMQTAADSKLLCEAFPSLLTFSLCWGEGQATYTFRTGNFPTHSAPFSLPIISEAEVTCPHPHVQHWNEMPHSHKPGKPCAFSGAA